MKRSESEGRIFRFGLFEADPAQNSLRRNGARTKIQDQPFRVLILLLQRPGEIVTREELRQKLWPEGTYVDYDGSLNVILKRLRATIDDDSDNPRFIETVPRHGYRFIAPVTAEETKVPLPSAAEIPVQAAPVVRPETTPPPAPVKPSRPQLMNVVVAFAVVALVGSAWLYWHGKHRVAHASELAPRPAKVPLRRSVAVLGFHNVTGKADDAWIATALSEMLSTELAGGGTLRLVSNEEVANLRHSTPWSQTDSLDMETTERIGTALNSDLLLLGSYTKIRGVKDGQLRLDVRLQDSKTGEILTEVAEIDGANDLFQLVTRVGGRMRDRLGVPRLEASGEASVLAGLPSNPDAARFYSLGLERLRDFDYQAAHGLFAQAIEAEPKFPLAYSMLSRTDLFLGHDDPAKAEAKRALDLAANLSRVQKMEVEASYYHAIADRAKAVEIYKVLFELYPDSLDYGLQLAKLQLESYQPEAALETIRRLRRLPIPAGEDPSIDLREGMIMLPRDADRAYQLYSQAATKALAKDKKLVYARAGQLLCYINRQRLQAPPECKEAYEAYLAAGDRDNAGKCLQLMAEANRGTGHNLEAIPIYEQAMRLFKEIGDREMVGVTLNNLSLVLEQQGQWIRAEQAFREARQNFAAVNDKANSASALDNIADILSMRGRLRDAADLHRQAWELADSSGRIRHEHSHIQHGSVLLLQGEIEPARVEIDAQIESGRAYKAAPWDLADALTVKGDIEKAGMHLDVARNNYQEAIDLIKKANSPIAGTQVSMAELSIAEDHADAGEALIRQAIAELEKEQSAGDEIGAYTSLGRALLAEGKPAEAQNVLGNALKLADLSEFPLYLLPIQILQARASAAIAESRTNSTSQLLPAVEKLRAVIAQAHRMGMYTIQNEARLALGEIELKPNPASARGNLTTLASDARGRGFALIAMQAERRRDVAGNVAAGAKYSH